MPTPKHPLRDRIIGRVRRGEYASVREIMIVATVSRPTVMRWLEDAGIDLDAMRMRAINKMHEREERYLAGLPPKRKPTKALLHWLAARAKRQWDERHGTESKGISAPTGRNIDR